jgi:peptidoglycan/LPS O-acetylase OafA/YrhL
VSIGLAEVSWYLIEMPLLTLKDKMPFRLDGERITPIVGIGKRMAL